MADSRHLWRLPDRTLDLSQRPLVMGIVNVTPDSFSDGGLFASTDAAVAHGLRLVEQGADILDIGGESSRPGAIPVTLEEELRRVLPVVEQLAAHAEVPLSVDTYKAEVARVCLAAGAHIVNDITALSGDPAMVEVVRSSRAGAILMHMQGTPATMQDNPVYADVVNDVTRFLEERLQVLTDLGIGGEHTVVDPGIGFGKTSQHNLELVARLEELQRLGRPVCLGVSRKGFFGKLLNRTTSQRLAGSLAAVCYALCRGAVQIVRVHDVAETCDAVKLMEALRLRGERQGARGEKEK
jgi:dihydropteroate synthase